jgi:ABC-2 type transport system ATP-binding protein
VADPISVKGLGKDYGKFTALGALDLTIPAGICFGYLGPNGAGKSTTIKILTNLLRPSRGQATLFGIDVQRQPRQALRKVGTVIETPEFYGYLSPLEVLAYAGRLRGMSKTDLAARSETVLKTVKLTGWADKRVETFSKGMKQRLAIAQALLHAPDLLILDEPTSGLDPRGMAEVRDIVKSVKREGRTVFMSSHLLGEVQEVCDSAALIDHGKLLLQGTLDELAKRADTTAFQATFLAPLNPDELEWVGMLTGVKSVTPSGNGVVEIRLTGGPEVQAAVISAIVRSGLQLTAFRPVGTALEQLYLEQIKETAQ